jgi:hypothetical protein
MKRLVCRGALVATAATIMVGVSFYLLVLPFVTDSLADMPDW